MENKILINNKKQKKKISILMMCRSSAEIVYHLMKHKLRQGCKKNIQQN